MIEPSGANCSSTRGLNINWTMDVEEQAWARGTKRSSTQLRRCGSTGRPALHAWTGCRRSRRGACRARREVQEVPAMGMGRFANGQHDPSAGPASDGVKGVRAARGIRHFWPRLLLRAGVEECTWLLRSAHPPLSLLFFSSARMSLKDARASKDRTDMPLFPKLTVTVLAVLITPVESPFPTTVTIGLSFICAVIVGVAMIGEFRRRRR